MQQLTMDASYCNFLGRTSGEIIFKRKYRKCRLFQKGYLLIIIAICDLICIEDTGGCGGKRIRTLGKTTKFGLGKRSLAPRRTTSIVRA